MHTGILFGLSAALSWGVADFLAQFSSRQIGAFRTLFYMQVAGVLCASAYIAAIGVSPAAVWQGIAQHPGLALFMGGASGAAMLSFYSALERGRISIVAPISSSYPALTVLLAYASGERLTAPRMAGVLCTICGVVLAAIAEAPKQGAPAAEHARHAAMGAGVLLALACALTFGVVYWALGFYAIPAWGGIGTVWIQRFSTLVWMAVLARPLRWGLRVPSGGALGLVSLVGLLDATGFLLSNLGFQREQVGVVTVLGSLFGAVAVLLAMVVLAERLSKRQWLGVALIFAGIVLINSPAAWR